jgi:hypothetical protein
MIYSIFELDNRGEGWQKYLSLLLIDISVQRCKYLFPHVLNTGEFMWNMKVIMTLNICIMQIKVVQQVEIQYTNLSLSLEVSYMKAVKKIISF